MRSRFAISLILVAVCALNAPTALAGSRTPSRPDRTGKVKATASGNTVRYVRARQGKSTPPVRVNPPTVHCKRWTVTVTTGSGVAAVSVDHFWKQCFSIATGRPTGPPREVPPTGAPGGEDVWTAVVPDPLILRENSARFVTQRLAWVWLPPEYFHGIPVDLRASNGAVLTGAAVARATNVSVNPGWGGDADCTLEAQFPYDRKVSYWEQRSCALLYMKSSVDEPGGAYTATATVTWIVSAVIDGEPVDPVIVVTTGDALFRVEELQALVTCIGGTETSCPTGSK
jgi:hypothetical protein